METTETARNIATKQTTAATISIIISNTRYTEHHQLQKNTLAANRLAQCPMTNRKTNCVAS
jgi:hypothetical protein